MALCVSCLLSDQHAAAELLCQKVSHSLLQVVYILDYSRMVLSTEFEDQLSSIRNAPTHYQLPIYSTALPQQVTSTCCRIYGIMQVMELEPSNATVREIYPLLQERLTLGIIPWPGLQTGI